MTRKIDGINEPSSPSKRRKLKNNNAWKTLSMAQTHSTAGNAKLLRWLDQANKQDRPVFNVFSTVIRKGARSSPDVYECTLNLNGKDYLKASYIVEPMKVWLSMTKYRKFTIGNQTHSCGDCVFVKTEDDSGRDWKAQVDEIRAADEHHVFLRCSWLENPEDLPKEVRSTPSYHGKFELVPSNKMDIIDALTVNGPLKVAYWEEANDDADMPAHGEYYWRQTYNHDTKVLSPQNPDRLIIKCSNQTCGTWLHASCLAQDVVQRMKGLEAEVNGKRQAQETIDRGDHIQSVDDAAAEDSITMAKIVALEAEALKAIITDKKTGEQTEEAVHCLICRQVIM
ncbi:hypothetical protein E4T44_00993 [Aureobasidium sp. EXF-8845]|nr:hypothetical protein E4T44_00993 [Aureobasidium sp. EXF-8845]